MNDATNIDSLLDATLDDLADLPEFKPFPVGMHKVLLSLELKSIGEGDKKKQGVEVSLKYLEPIELSNPEDVPPKAGDSTNLFCDLANEFGQGTFKMVAAAVKEAVGGGSNREIIAATKNIECAILTGLRKDKTDAEKFYTQLKSVAVL